MIIKYQGNKSKYLERLAYWIQKSNKPIYCEPFIGSAVIFLNLDKEFDEYHINDLEPGIINILNRVKNSKWEDFIQFSRNVEKKFGSIKNNKESYYLFRNKFNEQLWKSGSIEEGFATILLYNSCLNSMARWSKNGFNQSFGNRLFLPDKTFWTNSQSKLKRAKITCLEFFEWNKTLNNASLLVLDPPYIERPTSYQTVTNNWFDRWISWLQNNQNNHDIIYTDCEHSYLPTFKMEYLRTMQNTSPNRKEQSNGHNEVIFTNIKEEKMGF